MENKLNVSQLFGNTIQGEGISAGHPSVFLRLQGCTLRCAFCDTLLIWSKGDSYTIEQLLQEMERLMLVEKLREGAHLIVTGGSPLLQQHNLVAFFMEFNAVFGFLPYVEVENEAAIMPSPAMVKYVNQWNNSPKLSNSGIAPSKRINLEVLSYLDSLFNSWFKFVIKNRAEWMEVEYLISSGVINKEKVILMPEGATQQELLHVESEVLDIAIENNVRFSPRLHIAYWGNDAWK